MEFSAIPTVLLTSSSEALSPVQVAQRRPESVFHPSVWGDHFLAYASADMAIAASWWWKDLDVAGKLPFARDRLVEMYFWILGVYEPHYILAIRNLTKVMCLTSIIDDMYDASNATIEELVLFNDAIQRWEVSALDQLPDYMKLVYQTVLDTFNIIEDEMAKQGRSYGVEYAKSALKDLVGVYCKEAKWYHEGYVPSMDEHWPVALLSCGYQAVSTISFIGMGELATKEAFDWVSSNPLIVQGSSVICRLIDDVVGHKIL
ncbi:hypothetical protein RHSIM_Rhsim06G0194000 [Rhododendron simsii]|uniref:Terpene synthase metal-binding domain-containing protein n=1 Tax=Rhododendron simsii TaxID=118357 RepID=A0A834GWK1_RHOSS|nr:hypothetical protein RHSIM_Rhsim06G0194000 [Rhododendron simsii]